MAKVVLATRNQGKVKEMQALLASLDIELMTVEDREKQLGVTAPPVAETGSTFYENALLKAQGYCLWSGLPVIAEDSGLEVATLNGRPGIFSSRFSGKEGDDKANNLTLLAAMQGVALQDRSAQFRTVAIYLETATAAPIVAEGVWRGRIQLELQGEFGFGYDPLFWLDQYQCTSAQLSPEIKNELSHRGQAIRALIDKIKEQRTL